MKIKSPTHLAIWSTALLCLSTQTAMANPEMSPFGGFYLGGEIGGALGSARDGSTTNLSASFAEILARPPGRTLDASAQFNLQGAHKKNRLAVGIYAGYGCAWEDMYLGLEASLNRTDYRGRTHRASFRAMEHTSSPITIFRLDASASDSITLKTRLAPTEPAIDFRPGLFLTPCTMLYGRLGIGYNKIHLQVDTNPSVIIISPTIIGTPIANVDSRSKNKKVSALRLGIGFEQNICECISIRADYVNTNYRGVRVKTPGISSTVTGVNGGTTQLTTSTTAHVHSFYNNAITLGMSYYW